MKRLILALVGLALLLGMPLAASAQQLKAAPSPVAGQPQDDLLAVWGGGDPSASVYSSVYVPHVISILEKNRLAGYRWGGISQGTLQNAELVTLKPTNLALIQLDIGRQLNGQEIEGNKDKAKYAFTILHEDIGPECLYVVTKEKHYATFGHVLGNNFDLTVATGGPKSGAFGTWKILQSVFPELADIPVQHAGDAKKILKAVKENKESTFGFIVMRPDPTSDVFKEIASEGLRLVPVVDEKLNSTYTYLDLKVEVGGLFSFGKGAEGKLHTTACTSVALITGDPENMKNAPPRETARLKATIARMKAVDPKDLRPSLASWQDMWGSLKVTAVDKAANIAKASREALEDILKKEKR